jgi:hypothetical protein|tara:strand:- start:1150 stop:1299 length:150 start_codon:yes stop_codon:yes gene_type:complete
MWDLETNEYDDIKEIATEQGIDTSPIPEEANEDEQYAYDSPYILVYRKR